MSILLAGLFEDSEDYLYSHDPLSDVESGNDSDGSSEDGEESNTEDEEDTPGELNDTQPVTTLHLQKTS